jgi:hypothetical protein
MRMNRSVRAEVPIMLKNDRINVTRCLTRVPRFLSVSLPLSSLLTRKILELLRNQFKPAIADYGWSKILFCGIKHLLSL